MNLLAPAALCAAASGGHAVPAWTDCSVVAQGYQVAISRIAPALSSPENRDAIARVAYAEAGNQGDNGLAGVVYTLLNRIVDGGIRDHAFYETDAAGSELDVALVGRGHNVVEA
jgi:N-acetylmuramoyl-L-alanine amidase